MLCSTIIINQRRRNAAADFNVGDIPHNEHRGKPTTANRDMKNRIVCIKSYNYLCVSFVFCNFVRYSVHFINDDTARHRNADHSGI